MFLYRHIFAAVAFSFVVFLCTAIAPGSSQKLMRISFIMRRKSGSTVKAVNTVTWKRFKSTKKLSYNSSNHPKLCSFPARPQKYISNKCWEPTGDSQKIQNWYLLSVKQFTQKKKLTSQTLACLWKAVGLLMKNKAPAIYVILMKHILQLCNKACEY